MILLFVSTWFTSQRRQWRPTPVLLPGKSHGWRSLVGCSPWGREESNTIERLHFHFSLSCIGEGNGNPLQRSCLENPRDGGVWWAALCGVIQSRTRLKRLSSSSSSNQYFVIIFFLEIVQTLRDYLFMNFSSDQFISVTQSYLTLCNCMDCSMPGIPVHHQHPELAQNPVH